MVFFKKHWSVLDILSTFGGNKCKELFTNG